MRKIPERLCRAQTERYLGPLFQLHIESRRIARSLCRPRRFSIHTARRPASLRHTGQANICTHCAPLYLPFILSA